MTINTLVFSPFDVNTYIISDKSGECIIIDPACYNKKEEQKLQNFISEKRIKPVMLINTHSHLDHIFGNNFVLKTYGLKSCIAKEGQIVYEKATSVASAYGFDMPEPHKPGAYISENDILKFGNSEIKILHIPGHSPGSLVFYNIDEKFAIVGDVIFSGSIGRTDLPGGDFDTLSSGIKNKLYNLSENIILYPGHGEITSIKKEKETNPFVRG